MVLLKSLEHIFVVPLKVLVCAQVKAVMTAVRQRNALHIVSVPFSASVRSYQYTVYINIYIYDKFSTVFCKAFKFLAFLRTKDTTTAASARIHNA